MSSCSRPNGETYGAKIIREIVAMAPEIARIMTPAPVKDLSAIINAISEARREGLHDVADGLLRSLELPESAQSKPAIVGSTDAVTIEDGVDEPEPVLRSGVERRSPIHDPTISVLVQG